MPRLRRSRYVYFYAEDREFLDIASLLRGRAEVASLRRVLAFSVPAARESVVTRLELDLLLALRSDRWVDADAAGPPETIAALVGAGLVLSDENEAAAAEIRRREETLAAGAWSPHAALYHFLTTWRDVALGDGADSGGDGGRAALAAFMETFGPPPPHFHAVPGAIESVELPLAGRSGELEETLLARRTARAFDPARAVALDDLSLVLRYAFGCHGYAPVAEGVTLLRRTSPSGGAMHPVEAYPLVRGVEGLEPGLYHYAVDRHALDLLRPLSARRAAELADVFTCGQAYPRDAAALVVLTARFGRSFWKYRRHPRAYAVLLLDAGHLSQTFYLACAALGLGAFVTAAVNGANIEDELGLDGVAEGTLAVLGCGHPAAAEPGEPEFVPYVPRETAI